MQYLAANPLLFYEVLHLICRHLTNNNGDNRGLFTSFKTHVYQMIPTCALKKHCKPQAAPGDFRKKMYLMVLFERKLIFKITHAVSSVEPY